MNTHRPITLLICALGGEGGGVLTEWLIDIARHAGFPAQSTSIPGVAQRTGATTYYLEVFPQPFRELGGKHPIFSLNPVPGALDGLISSELLETTRQVGLGLPSRERTLVITSSARTLTTQERMQMKDGRTDSARLLDVIKAMSREHHVFDMGAMAQQSGTIVSAVMLGAVAGSGLFPFPKAAYEAVIGEGGKSAAASLRGFQSGFEAVSKVRTQAAMVADLLLNSEHTTIAQRGLPADLGQVFPPAVHDMLSLGHARVLEYQDADYAQLYVQRLQQVLAAERQADPAAAHGYAITREMARWLALWMAFDDIIRVADLKSRASRWQRVKGEVKAQDGDLLQVYDHFKPGVPEFAAMLPKPLADRVLAWDRRRQQRGKEPWALPIKVGSHSVFGMASLRALASLRWLRRRGSRFAQEQELIEQWLASVVQGTRAHWSTGFEIAQCGQLIKGYGSTNERGKENLLHIVGYLAQIGKFASDEARSAAIAAARAAAMADDAGTALDATLRQHGAPAREIKAQPIRWIQRRPGQPQERAEATGKR
jgi:indolepyruvate ferredoxin oxidoreductase beta subunit